MIAIRVRLVPPNLKARFDEPRVTKWIEQILVTTRNKSRLTLNTGTRTGRWYSNLPNRSSAPGEPPRTQSGALARSHTVPQVVNLQGSFGETAPHAAYLEFGSPGGKIAPRPHLRPALRYALDQHPFPVPLTWSGGGQ